MYAYTIYCFTAPEFNKTSSGQQPRLAGKIEYEPSFWELFLFSSFGDWIYEGWNFNSGNYLFTTDTK